MQAHLWPLLRGSFAVVADLLLSVLETSPPGALFCLPLAGVGGRPCRAEACLRPAGLLGFLWATEKRGYFCLRGLNGWRPARSACLLVWLMCLAAATVSATALTLENMFVQHQELKPKPSVWDERSFLRVLPPFWP